MLNSLKHVRSVLAIARLGSFTRAATELHMAQSTLTVQVRQLEEDLGLRIFDRTQRSVTLTVGGRQLVPSLERLVQAADALLENTSDLSKVRRGLISVAALPSIASQMLPRALAAFHQDYPGVRVIVHDVVGNRIVQMVKSGDAELGITGDLRRDRELAIEPLTSDHLCAFLPLNHALSGKAVLGLRDLMKEPLIVTGVDSSVRELLDRSLLAQSLSLTPSYEVNYLSTALGMVECGLGVAILPESALRAGQELSVRIAAIEQPMLKRNINLIRRRSSPYSSAAEKLVCALRLAASQTQKRTIGTQRRGSKK